MIQKTLPIIQLYFRDFSCSISIMAENIHAELDDQKILQIYGYGIPDVDKQL